MRLPFSVVLLVSLFLIGCGSTADKVKEEFLPLARGEADEIILVIDSALYAGQVGVEIRSMYQQYVRILPQDEYQFALNKVNPLKFNSVLKYAKNLIMVMTLDKGTAQNREVREYFTDNSLKMIQRDTSLYYTVRKDEFARGQIVLYLFGQNEEQLVNHIKDNKSNLVELFESAVRQRTRDKLFAGTKNQLMKAITEDHGYEIQIPYGYDLAKNLKDFMWLRKLEADSEFNVFVYEGPYRSQTVFNDIGELRDDITGTYLRDGEKPDKYIERQEIIPVFTERVNFNGNFAVEARGLWAISDKSAGGPFVSYTLVDEVTQKLYYVEGYVYAPGTKKKKLLREVEAIISTFKLPEGES